MNKVTKGALATAAGVALLLGGGGTLAVWNDSQEMSTGSIIAGELGLTAGTGVWTSNLSDAAGGVITIAGYKIVPGETLTYTQDLDLTLVGNEIEATLSATAGPGSIENPFTAPNLLVATTYSTLVDTVVTPVPTTLNSSHDNMLVTATTTFTFDGVTTTDLEDVGAEYDFTDVVYVLNQTV